MSEYIDRVKLAKASHKNLIRLAKALKLHGCSCNDLACRQDIEEKITRELAYQSMERHKKEQPNGNSIRD
jgi:hypothetical protein